MTISKAEYDEAVKAKESAQNTINAYHDEQRAAFDKRIKENPVFTPDELVYSAAARCNGCGAGLAYPKDCGPGHYWDCADVLTGKIKNPGKEHQQFPFMYYSIKSENQPSANGQTTRPTAQQAGAQDE